MERHHEQSIENLVAEFEKDPSILALILGGSLAHGFAKPDSDIDVSIVVDSAEYQRRKRENRLHYNNRALCAYEQGYIDGKYVDSDFLQLVAQRGSDPARYAYQGNRVLFSRLDGLEDLLARIVQYPVQQKRERTDRFVAQLLAWRWYYSQAIRQQNDYLVFLSIQKLILFSARLILVNNELLFPYHKWLLRVLEAAPRQPEGMLADIRTLTTDHCENKVQAYCHKILTFLAVDPAAADSVWPSQFMKDTELRWVTEESAIDDI
jgi:hypothetical protein